MKLVNCFYVFSSVLAVVCGGHIPDEKLLDEEALTELGFPHLSHPYLFGLSAVGDPTFESDFDLSPPPLPPLEVVRESRTRFRQRPTSTGSSNTNGDRGSARRNENASRSNDGNRNSNNNNRSNNGGSSRSNNNNRSNNNRNNNNRNNNRNPTDTNELSNSDEDLMALLFRNDNNGKREVFLRKQQRLEDIRNFYNVGEIRKKREADPVAEADPTPGRFRGKRGYCKKCGGGGGGLGGGVLPVYQVPVYGGGHGGYRPSYGGGCNSCGGGGGGYPGFGGGHGGGYPGFGGGGYPGFGGGGGHSGSYSQSSSHASSSSGGWGYGK